MPVVVSYPHSPLTGIVLPMTRRRVRTIAAKVRRQLVEDTLQRRIEPDALADATQMLVVNDFAFAACWDLSNDVHTREGERVMGATEWDPAEPDSVMVAVNGLVLGDAARVLSTAAHELGHVIFDAPSWIRTGTDRTTASLATLPPAELGRVPQPLSRGDEDDIRRWSEWRADEFMGGLLTPPTLLKTDFLRLAKRHRLPPSHVPSRELRGAPAFDGHAVEAEAAFEILGTLAERYGVTPTFIRVRLDIYDLLRVNRPYIVI
ncbi:MAG: hypothetical protein INR68_05575 [Methylobacterium mesophilicum]|nr:hypothetical protein [Methylobacterium mesophilicum]